MSYSLRAAILREAKQGYQPVKGAEQQLPLTLILDRDGTVLFCHYGASLMDVPEDCAAIQSLLEEMELTPGLEPEEDELPYEELQTAVAAESRPRSRHGRERPETTDNSGSSARCVPTRNRIWKKHRCLVGLMTPMTTNEKVPAGSNGRHFCFAAMQRCRADILSARAYRITAALAAHTALASVCWICHFVQPGQAHGHPRGGRSYRFPAAFCSWHGTPAPRAGPRAARS